MDPTFYTDLNREASGNNVLLVLDGLCGLPGKSGKTELEAARTPHMDALAPKSICGLHNPVGAGITPGSGPGHLALFGYDPIKYMVGRGVLAALGIGFSLEPTDVAARGNFCTVDEEGVVQDRRAGRLDTDKNIELCRQLADIQIPGGAVFLKTVKEHRFLLVLRGDDLGDNISDTDPQQIGLKPVSPRPHDSQSKKTAHLIDLFLNKAQQILKDRKPANMVLLRGFSRLPEIPTVEEAFGLKALAIAGYPMYRGLAKLLGMTVVETGASIEEEVETLQKHWNDYDYFFVHVKGTDSAGEDGDFDRKVAVIEEVDRYIGDIIDLQPAVFIITGDHSTPSVLKSHSWHPVPILFHAQHCRYDGATVFDERSCAREGSLGRGFPATDIMPLALAYAERLDKFGA
jgi:2,3-bisphosphoglycerate-independent phosphoglycerate mutase